jgi:hypothetical protein
MHAWLGWTATAVFTASYLCRNAAALRRVQAAGALLWIAYGVLIGAPPVIAANVLVMGVALWSIRAGRSPHAGLSP